jgi:AcrR family transcriptional regulator
MKKKNNYDKILDAAQELFLDIGYFETTTKKISKQSGLAEGTIYRYFENKEDLFCQVVDRVHNIFIDGIKKSVSPERTVKENLERFIEWDFYYNLENPKIKELFDRDVRYLAITKKIMVIQIFNNLIEHLADIFDWGKGRGEIDPEVDSRSLAMTFFGIFDMHMTALKIKGLKMDEEALKHMKKFIPELILNGASKKG